MKNVVVVGCGRSGTSLVTGSIMGSGRYWAGAETDHWDVDAFNPKGYYEDTSLVHLNERLLSTCAESPLITLGRSHPDTRKAPIQEYWLGLLEEGVEPLVDSALRSQMEGYLARCPTGRPFCLKDPQFSYTLSTWLPFFSNVAFVAVFRDPLSTADSLVRMTSRLDHLKPLGIDRDYAVELWTCMNRRIVEQLASQRDGLFLHARQVFEAAGRERLEAHLGGAIDREFGEARLMSPPQSTAGLPAATRDLYAQLCELAGFSVDV